MTLRKSYTVGRKVVCYNQKEKIEGYLAAINFEDKSVIINNSGREVTLKGVEIKQTGRKVKKDIAVFLD